ncbi:MAG TPA: EamA family transporter [Lachnospiraceae bacterium]|nr:EamA family transporter [Lachnospiraceae bacterium]
MESNSIKGHLFAIFTVIVWGTTFIATKILLKELTPIEILFIRFVLGFIALTLFSPKRLGFTKKAHEVLFMAAGLCGVTLYFLLENIALTYSFASNVGIIISIAPFFTAIVSHIFLDNEKFKLNFIIGFLVAITGIVVISLNGSAVLKLNPIGDVLTILAALVWAFYSVLTKKISSLHYNTILTTRRVFFYGIIFMVPALFVMDFSPNLQLFTQPKIIFNLLYLGLGASALCFVIWNLAIRMLGPVKTSVYIYASPVVTVITSALVLHERITPIAVIGTALTLTGLIISELKIGKAKENEEQALEGIDLLPPQGIQP